MTGAAAAQPVPDRRLDLALRVAPFVLLAISLAVTLAVRAPGPADLPVLLGLTAAVAVYRVWWPGRFRSAWARTIGFVVHLGLTLALVSLSPLYGVYAFVGYLDAVAVFQGTGLSLGLVGAASMNALAQSGGPAGVLAQPLLFAFLLAANGGLAVGMVHVDRSRERTVTRLRQALADLEEAHRVNADLQDRLVAQARASGVADERQRLSREIHDTVAQGLIATLRQIEAAAESATMAAAQPHLDRADRTARDCLAEARRAVAALASPLLDEHDLPGALRAMVASWSQDTGLPATVWVEGATAGVQHDGALLRIAQESLANVARHARATHAEVSLHYGDGSVRLEVHDDGQGMDPAKHAEGHGLAGMRARLAAVGGELVVTSIEGEGCTVSAVIPR